MKKILSIYFAALGFLLCPPVFAQQQAGGADDEGSRPYSWPQDRTSVGSDVLIRADEKVRNLVVVGGNAVVHGSVEGDLVVVGGSLTLTTNVQGDLVVVAGKATLGPTAEVERHTTLVGGPFEVSPKAILHREMRQVTLGGLMPKVEWLKQWIFTGLVLGRPLPPDLTWAWIVGGIFLVLYCFLAFAFPRPIIASVEAIERNPITALMTGLLTLFLLGPLCFLLAISVAGIIAIPFLLCGIFVIILFGKSAVFGLIGRGIGRAFGEKAMNTGLAVLVGGALLMVSYAAPVLGMILWGASTLLGLGSVVLAIAQSLKREAAAVANVAVINPSVSNMTPAPPAAAVAAAPGASSDYVLMRRAGFWRRFAAGFLDFVLLAFLIKFMHGYFLLMLLAYLVGMWTWRGTTIGGIVMGLKVIRVDGRPVDFPIALVRGLASFFSAAVLFLGFLWCAWDREKQTWHDKIAGTVVVRIPKGMSLL